MIEYSRFRSPLGWVHLLASSKGLAALYFDPQIDDMERRFPSAERSRGLANIRASRAEEFLTRYFEGGFELEPEIPLDLWGTPFQQRVWRLLRGIPVGHTTSYGRLAAELANPKAARAVGAAVGRNPVSILVPCHRVVGAAGRLTGYAGGVERKRFLLEHEGVRDKTEARALASACRHWSSD